MKTDSHTIENALKRGELTDEEGYFVLRLAGHRGYDRTIRAFKGPWKVARQWLVWFGGWESPELCQWDLGWPAWTVLKRDCVTKRRRLSSPCPLSLFGHRVTFFGWGAQVRCFGGYVTFSASRACDRPNKLYWSPDGTPGHERARLLLASRTGRDQFRYAQAR